MKINVLFKPIVESVKKIDPVKAIGVGGTVLGLVASAMSSSCQKKEMEKAIEEKAEKAVQKLMKQNGGVQ